MAGNPQKMITLSPQEVSVNIGQELVDITATIKNQTPHQILITSPQLPFPEVTKTAIVDPFGTTVMKFTMSTDFTERAIFEFEVWDNKPTRFTESITLKTIRPDAPEQQPAKRQRIHDARECSLCSEWYNNDERAPRTFHCGHTHCHSCLEALWKYKPKNQSLQCPNCNEKILAKDAKSPNDLPKGYAILSLIEQMSTMVEPPPAKKPKPAETWIPTHDSRCAEPTCGSKAVLYCSTCKLKLCEECCDTAHPNTMTIFANHKIFPIDEMPVELPKCARHQDQEAEFICTDSACQRKKITEICHICLSNEHAGHTYELFSQKLALLKNEAEPIMRQVDSRLSRINYLLENRKASLYAVDRNGATIKMREKQIYEIHEKNLERDLKNFRKFIREESNKLRNDMTNIVKDKEVHEKAKEELKVATSATTSNLGLVQDCLGTALDALGKGLSCENEVTPSSFELLGGEIV